MKKIIATVLAMVMALALCATAFAANPEYDTAYDEKGNDITNDQVYVVATDVAQKPTGTNENGLVKGFTVTYGATAATATHAAKYIAATAADYDLKLTAAGRADLYLKKAPNGRLAYDFKVTAFTAIGEKCEQLDVAATGTYYSHTNAAGVTAYYVASENGATNVLFNNQLIAVDELVGATLVPHTWKAATYNKDNTVATFKCADCGTVATVYKTADAAKAAGAGTVAVVKGYVVGYTYTAGTTAATTTTTSSPKTFDAGIAMYVGMALTSVAGSAVVIGKKKEF